MTPPPRASLPICRHPREASPPTASHRCAIPTARSRPGGANRRRRASRRRPSAPSSSSSSTSSCRYALPSLLYSPAATHVMRLLSSPSSRALGRWVTHAQERGTPITRIPTLGHHELDLYALYKAVTDRDGVEAVRQFHLRLPPSFSQMHSLCRCCLSNIVIALLKILPLDDPSGDREQGLALGRYELRASVVLYRLRLPLAATLP